MFLFIDTVFLTRYFNSKGSVFGTEDQLAVLFAIRTKVLGHSDIVNLGVFALWYVRLFEIFNFGWFIFGELVTSLSRVFYLQVVYFFMPFSGGGI